jgi:sortase A
MRIAALLVAALTLVGALAPLDALPLGDKAMHLIAFALIGALAARAGWPAWLVLAALAGLAVATEAAQAVFAPSRSVSVVDAAASMLGAGLGVAAARLRGRDLIAAAFACVALGVGFDLVVETVRRPLTHALMERAWREGVSAHEARAPWLGAPARIAARLTIGEREILVADSVERRALAMAPGLWPGLRPGQRGTTIILGHRNGMFGALRDIHANDVIAIASVSGERRFYRVVSRDVVRWNASGLTPNTPDEMLALATCWPFWSDAPTPWRLVVRAEPVQTSESAGRLERATPVAHTRRRRV